MTFQFHELGYGTVFELLPVRDARRTWRKTGHNSARCVECEHLSVLVGGGETVHVEESV